MPFYPNVNRVGTDALFAQGDGRTIIVRWYQAEHSVPTNKIAYNIYYSTVKENIFTEGPKYVSIDGYTEANIIGLTPGQQYFFCVRPMEYNPSIFNLVSQLPVAYDNLRFYPQSLLRSDINDTTLTIPLVSVDDFPNSGVIIVGTELIQYTSIDSINNNLLIPPGTSGTPATLVDLPGPDGYFAPFATNVGDGYITNLTAVPNSGASTESWSIICSFVQRDGYNNPMVGTAKFIATGSISGTSRDGYTEPILWTANGPIVSSNILSFAIVDDGYVFREGDGFLIKVIGTVPGTPSGRGYNFTHARSHTTSGFDGYFSWDPTVRLYTIGEDNTFDRIYVCLSRFEYPNYQYTPADGYHQVLKDLLSSDLAGSDANNIDFPPFDFAGFHRTDPVQLLNGTCVGSYIGGEMGCIDKFGNFNILRGFSLQDQNTQRQEVLLSVTGRDAILIRRVQTGITCACYLPSSEYPDDRCPKCYGTKFVFGYEQYFNPRISSGRIRVRVGPTAENLKMHEAGLESEFPLDMFTLAVPTIKTRDVIVLFDTQGINEEFRYEVGDVIRNETIVGMEGGQHLKTFRIRKFDPAYQIRIFRDSSMFPSKLNTSIGFVPGIPPHTHEIVISEKITSISQINQTTSVVQGHNHWIKDGIVSTTLGHAHVIILP
jgi:hypothetical protein